MALHCLKPFMSSLTLKYFLQFFLVDDNMIIINIVTLLQSIFSIKKYLNTDVFLYIHIDSKGSLS